MTYEQIKFTYGNNVEGGCESLRQLQVEQKSN